MTGTTDKIKDALHLRRKSKSDPATNEPEPRGSIDSEVEAMTPEERERYFKEFADAEKAGQPKKGSLLERLIARGNKRTEEQLAEEARARQAAKGETVIR